MATTTLHYTSLSEMCMRFMDAEIEDFDHLCTSSIFFQAVQDLLLPGFYCFPHSWWLIYVKSKTTPPHRCPGAFQQQCTPNVLRKSPQWWSGAPAQYDAVRGGVHLARCCQGFIGGPTWTYLLQLAIRDLRKQGVGNVFHDLMGGSCLIVDSTVL